MRGSVRVAALSGLPVIYVWTHDSVGLGEDGPTHQPVEHYAALRAIPNLWFVRPADANETAAAWALALERTSGPTALALTRQKLPVLAGTAELAREGVRRGGYVDPRRVDRGGRRRARPRLRRHRLRGPARRRGRRGPRGRGDRDPRRQPPLLGSVRGPGRRVPRERPPGRRPQARRRRDRRLARLGALGRRRGRDRRPRPLRRLRPGRHDPEASSASPPSA